MELKKYKLGDCLILIKNGAVIQQRKGCSGIPITRIETLSNNRFNRDRLGYADIKDESLYVDYILDDCDLLMSHINSREFLGRTVLYQQKNDERIIHGMNLLRIKTNPALLDSYYAYYLFQTGYFKKLIDSIRKDAINQSSISISDICNLKFDLPSVENQKKIVKILKILDQKIELNHKINDNLEAMAKQLYDYWFVQFDFPNEEGKPYKSSGGKMVWNEKLKREIPEGWEVGNLSDYLQVITERVSASTVNESTKYAPIEVLPRKKMSFNECAPIENAISGLCAFRHKNILLSNRRVYFHKVCIAAFDGITRDTVIVLKPNANDLLGYSYQLVNDNVFIEYATRHSYGSEQPVLSWESAKMYKVLKPKSRLDVLYSKCADSIIDCVIENELEIADLTKQRDELLPLLMNGQVSVNYHLSKSEQ